MPERTTLTGKTAMIRMTEDEESYWDDCDDCNEWVERLLFFVKMGQQKFKFEKQEHLLQISEFAFNVEIM